MESARSLRVRGLQASAEKPEEAPESKVNRHTMRLPKLLGGHSVSRRVFVLGVILGFVVLVMISMAQYGTENSTPVVWHVDTAHKKRVHEHVHRVLTGQCHQGRARKKLVARLPNTSHVTQPFLWKDVPLNDHLFQYPPPFGFRGLQGKVENLLKQLPDSSSAAGLDNSKECRRCVVMGNGGILRGLELGQLIDKFDVIIRLNSGPLGEFSVDVGNRTSIRMSYPEGTPLHWVDKDAQTLFVAVVHKSGDLSWTSAMINNQPVPLLDWLFFWQKVPDHIPLQPERYRLLNLDVIREAALDLLKYPPPTQHLLGWDKNVPTLGISALNLASLLCDEVSLAGFGYNLSQQGAPLHYYDHLTMSAMYHQKMHDVNSETKFLQSLVKDGVITDLTGGIHCSFCSN